MATLTDQDRQRVTNGLMRYWSKWFEEIANLSSTQLKGAVDATDQWIDDNQGSFNQALPAQARTNLTLAQKTLMFCVVAAFRVSKEFAIKLVGGVD